MSQILRAGQTVRAELSNLSCTVDKLLGSGGQGEVYRVRLASTPMALKWYYPQLATPAQRQTLEALLKLGSPSELFLWPVELTSANGVPGFGYLMPLREPRFKDGNDLAKRRIDPPFRVLATVGLNLAQAFLQLHARGLAYRDISFGNIFLDPANGDILVCDNDNVGIDRQVAGGVYGTPRFMAPEIVRGEAVPSTLTDQFSLAVLLYYLFVMHHPLEGAKEAQIRCLDQPAMTRLYGTEAVYIADPRDGSNRPVRGLHDNFYALWPIYPSFLKSLFERAFTLGIRNSAERVKESEWRGAMVRLRDVVAYCGRCAAENFYDPDAPATTPAQAVACWSCKTPLRYPMLLRLGKHVVMLNHNTRLYPHHIDDARAYDFAQPVAEVARHPSNPDVWGLKNLTKSPWTVTNAAGQTSSADPGRSVTLAPGTRIAFGKSEGEIVAP